MRSAARTGKDLAFGRCRNLRWICIPCTEVLQETRDSSLSSSTAVVPGVWASRTTPASGTQGIGSLEQIIEQEGAFGLDDKVADFPQAGKLGNKGRLVTLPYCWFSSVHAWDNPSLCAVDTYDLSGDDVTLRSRAYNRLDIVPVVKAIEYAEQHDYHAVLGYCSSAQIAHSLVRR